MQTSNNHLLFLPYFIYARNINANAQPPLQAVLERLGLTAVAANEFINNGVIDAYSFRMLTTEDLNRLIKQIHRDNQGAGLLFPFMSQQ